MSLAAIGSVLAALGVILAAIGMLVRVVRRYTGSVGALDAGVRLEVLNRVALGPRQGLAVVRIGERVLAVSLGDGGIRPVLELGDAAAVLPARPTAAEVPARWPLADEFGRQLPRALRASAVASLLAAGPLLVAGQAAAHTATAATDTAVTEAATLDVAAREAVPAETVAAREFATPEAAAPEATPEAAALGAHATAVAEAVVETAAPTVLATAAQVPAGGTGGLTLPALPRVDLQVGGADGEPLRLSGTVGTVLLIGVMALLPALLLLMTSFTRILIVLHFLRQALGTQTSPPGHLVAALALLLTAFVMAPTLTEVNSTALEPWMQGELAESEMLQAAVVPFRQFMLAQTPDRDVETFLDLSGAAAPATEADIPLTALVSAFATSELRAAFQIGFALFLPFLVIDIVVASVLMSMGMFMMPPTMFSLPCKLLLFVLVDGWSLVVKGLVSSFV